jgi:Zn finger protein HypA/HybF involved in hydrogenase expression
MIIINMQCDDCQATCSVEHELDEKLYEVENCPFCGGEFIHIEEEEN